MVVATLRRIVGLGVVSLGLFVSPAQAQPVPEDVHLFEAVKDRIPPMTYQGKPYGGLSIHKLLAKAAAQKVPGTPFFVGHAELADGDEPPIPGDVILYAGLYCELGVRDAGPDGPHFSKSLNPFCRVEQYDGLRVVYCNHGFKSQERATPAGIQAAVDFFSKPLPAILDMRPARNADQMPLLAEDQRGGLPLRKAVQP